MPSLILLLLPVVQYIFTILYIKKTLKQKQTQNKSKKNRMTIKSHRPHRTMAHLLYIPIHDIDLSNGTVCLLILFYNIRKVYFWSLTHLTPSLSCDFFLKEFFFGRTMKWSTAVHSISVCTDCIVECEVYQHIVASCQNI